MTFAAIGREIGFEADKGNNSSNLLPKFTICIDGALMASSQLYMKFYPKDWMADERLRHISLAAKGLWFNLICLMHIANRDGRLFAPNGSPYTIEDIANRLRLPVEEARTLVGELLENKVMAKDKAGVFCNRSMAKKFKREKPTTRKFISKRLRFKILARDNFTCRYCGGKAPDVQLVLDHVLPVSIGGETTESNLMTSCEDCNAGKSDLIIPAN